jgi:hypothetical protein
MRWFLSWVLVAWASSCQCGFVPVEECVGQACLDAGPPPCSGGTPELPHLCLAPAQPAWCPVEWPFEQSGQACPAAGRCDYVYPRGVHPSGCDATCAPGDGGLRWAVLPCT